MRPWLGAERTLESLNRNAAGVRTASGRPLRFVPPGTDDRSYELRIHGAGEVPTRPDNLHDWFNALAWLAFPRTKAQINALHAAYIPRESGQRGPFRDLLTIFDEGGAVVVCDDAELIGLLRDMRWRDLFWQRRSRVLAAMRFVVIGHAVLEKALAPWPGITCKAIVVPAGGDVDAQASQWLAGLTPEATPRELLPLPVFGYPGWFRGNERAEFYDDTRYFRSYGNAG